jgi:hypothetical protein
MIRSGAEIMATSGELCLVTAEALGISFETTREHLRHIRRAGMISFKGHGRGAAAMTTLDAARLLIAAAGSSFVKDSLETLEGFGKLKPMRKSPRQRSMKEITLEAHLADVMQMLIHEREQLPDAYRRPVGPGVNSRIALRMMSVVSARPGEFPRTATVWRFLNSYSTLDFTVVRFSSSELSNPSLNSADYAVPLGEAGLIQTRDVPAWVLAEIALAL